MRDRNRARQPVFPASQASRLQYRPERRILGFQRVWRSIESMVNSRTAAEDCSVSDEGLAAGKGKRSLNRAVSLSESQAYRLRKTVPSLRP